MAHLVIRTNLPSLSHMTTVSMILPDEPKGPMDVMYLLHGLSDDDSSWVRWSNVERHVNGLNLLVVMPDGGRSFYADAIDGEKMRTALGHDLAHRIRSWFHVKPKWCVSGLSMGGYGALHLALSYPRRFVSAVSMSGALSCGQIPATPELVRDIPEYKRIYGSKPLGSKRDVVAQVRRLSPKVRPKLRFDCGTEDFLIEANRHVHREFEALGFDHTYAEYPGDHNWDYWDLHVQDALKFHQANLGF